MTDTAIKERPILFSAPMVQAILDGTKTQTRRVVGSGNSTVLGHSGRLLWDHLQWDRGVRKDGIGTDFEYLHVAAWNPLDGPVPSDDAELARYRVRCLWEPGDRLWVRETYFPMPWVDANNKDTVVLHYRADGEDYACKRDEDRWRSPIHMPRWASRITLEVKSVRVERLQDITEEDARAEGVEPMYIDDLGQTWKTYRRGFESVWDSINGKAHPWASNPWVWAVTFARIGGEAR